MTELDSELNDFLIGRRIGVGAFRYVYELRYDNRYVIKVASDEDGRAVNLLEWKVWCEVGSTPAGKWFADVVGVSGGGKYLVQKKVEMLPRHQYPKEIPHFFTDTKYSNFGYLEGKGFVCLDFGSFNMFRGISAKMRKADWWE